MKRKKPRQPLAWRHKLPGMFFEVAGVNRAFERHIVQIERRRAAALTMFGPPTDTHKAAVDSRALSEWHAAEAVAVKALCEIALRYGDVPCNPLAYSYLAGAPQEIQDDKLVRWFFWGRHRQSLDRAIAADATGSLAAYKKLVQTGEDVRRAVYRLGGLKPFKTDLVHRQFLELVICFEKPRLTAEELAECADEYCGCGIEHDASAIRKQYLRLLKDLRAARRRQTR